MFRVLSPAEVGALYPGGRVRVSGRMFVLHTMFNMAECCLLAQTLHHYETRPGATVTHTEVTSQGVTRTYADIFKVSREKNGFTTNNSCLFRRISVQQLMICM